MMDHENMYLLISVVENAINVTKHASYESAYRSMLNDLREEVDDNDEFDECKQYFGNDNNWGFSSDSAWCTVSRNYDAKIVRVADIWERE